MTGKEDLACGLQLTHCLVPPTPGPLTAAGMLGVDVGQMILMGTIVSIPMLIVVMFYVKAIGKKIYQIPNPNGGFDRMEYKAEYIKSMDQVEKLIDAKTLPSFGASIAPIIVPVILIFVKTVWDMTATSDMKAGALGSLIAFFGAPIIALVVGTLLAIYGLVKDRDTKEVLGMMDGAIKDTGIIMLITGAGGSLGNVIKVAGIDTHWIWQEGRERLTKEPMQIVDGCIDLPKKGGLGIEVDREQVMKANKLYIENCLGARDDALGMQYLIPGWTFDPKRPCMVR